VNSTMGRRTQSPSVGLAVAADPQGALALRLGSLVVLFVVAIGVPAVLFGTRAKPPWSLLAGVVSHPISVIRSFGGPTSDFTAVDFAVLVAWIAWTWLFVCLAAEVVGRAMGRPTTRLPVSRHIQAMLALLVSASVAIIPSTRVHVTARTVGLGGRQTQTSFLLASDEIASQVNPTGCSAHAETVSREESSPLSELQRSSGKTLSYVVQPGDTMWSIAGRELGSPLRWRQIAALNLGRVQSDGRTLTQAGWILPGWVLLLPRSTSDESHTPTRDPVPPPLAAANGRNDAKVQHPYRSEAVSSTTMDQRKPSSAPHLPPKKLSPADTADETSLEVQPSPSLGGDHTATRTRDASRSDPSKENHRNVPLAPFGYGLLGAGVVVASFLG
jgi:hypothetical protein